MQNIPHVISFCLFFFFFWYHKLPVGFVGLASHGDFKTQLSDDYFCNESDFFFFFLFPNHCPENAQTEIVDGLRPGL